MTEPSGIGDLVANNGQLVGTILTGLGIGALGIWNYLKGQKKENDPRDKNDFAILAGSIADMNPIRDANKFGERGIALLEKMNETQGEMVKMLERIARSGEERGSLDREDRRVQDRVDKLRGGGH